MKGLIIASKGIESRAANDVKELIGCNAEVLEACVRFDAKKLEDFCILCYKCQSADRILYLLGEFEFEDFFDELGDSLSKVKFDEWIVKHKKFKVECLRQGIHGFNSVDVESALSKELAKRLNLRFDLKDYEITFFAYVCGNKFYFGIDFGGFELNKRQYKIFLHPGSLRGTIAYDLMRTSNFDPKKVLLDPFCRDGVIAIESALYAAEFPVNYYNKEKFAFKKLKLGIDYEKLLGSTDKKIKKKNLKIHCFDHLFKFVDYARKNAKIAGIDKIMNFSRVELDWLDIKFKKNEVDAIATIMPHSKEANLGKIYNEFFYQSHYILDDKGFMVLISTLPELVKKHAEANKFGIVSTAEVWSGNQALKKMVLKK